MRLLLSIILILSFSEVSGQFQGLIINEFSQGDAGSKEYIELLVAGKRTCNDSTADIRGWIVDDQNGWYGASSLTQGHYRFKNIPAWAAVPIGSIILLYNSAVNGKNNSITLPDDLTDANKDLIYIIPINSSAYLEEFDNEPSNLTGAAYVYPPAISTAGYTGTSNLWMQHIALNNGSDVISTVSPQDRTTHYFSIGYGYAITAGFKTPSVSVSPVGAGTNCYLTDGNYTTAASWTISAVPLNETPGFSNGGANTTWINEMRITPKALTSFTTACSNGPYSFFSQTITTSGAYTLLTNNTNGCIDTNHLYVVIKKEEVIDTAGCDLLIYEGISYTASTIIVDNIRSTVIDCDSLVQTVRITINKSSSSLTQACAGIGQTHTFNSLTLTTSGSYSAILNNSAGCDSVATLFLVVATLQQDNIRGCGAFIYKGITYTSTTAIYDTVKSLILGCDSIIKMITIQIDPVKTITISDCANEGDTYLFNNQFITTSGLYTAQLASSSGCDSLVNLYLVFKKAVVQNVSGCDSVVYSGTTYYASITLYDTLRSFVSHCDSLLTLTNIIINQRRHSNITACTGPTQIYNFNGQALSTSGHYTTTYSTANCDSVVHLYLLVTAEHIQTIEGCGTLVYNGSVYASSTIIRDTVKSNFSGCDSIYKTITILIKPLPFSSKTVCIKEGDTYDFNGQLLAVTGTYTTTYTQSNKCDSTVSLYLLVSIQQSQTLSGCNVVVFNGFSYIASTILSDTIRSTITFCDSIYRTTNIMILPKPESFTSTCIQGGSTYNFNGQLLTTGGNYSTVYGMPGRCDSTVHLYLVVSSKQLTNKRSCDSVLHNGTVYTASVIISDTIRSMVTSCDSIITIVTIQVDKKPTIQISENITTCKGNNIQLTASSPTGIINWTGFGTRDTITVNPVLTTTYSATALDADGCTNTATVTVSVQNFNLEIFATPVSVLAGQPVFLQTISTIPYTVNSWHPTSFFQKQDAKTQRLFPDSSCLVTVTGQSASGCKDTAEVLLIVTPFDDVYIPSGFTPNGDGKNEIVRVAGSGIATIDFKIFNRWGQTVFFTTDKNKGWDGKLAGKMQPSDTYIYIVSVKKTNGQIVEKKGTVILIK